VDLPGHRLGPQSFTGAATSLVHLFNFAVAVPGMASLPGAITTNDWQRGCHKVLL